MNNVVALQEVAKTPRVPRRPKHPYTVEHKPLELQMVGLMPVLPMETMKNLKIQSRAVTAPVRAPLVGWWLEYYVFYVTHRQMENQTYLDMMLDPTIKLPGSSSQFGQAYWGQNTRGHNWFKAVQDTIVKYWFREPDERDEVHELRSGRPLVKLDQQSWWDSITMDAQLPSDTEGEGLEEEERLRNIWEYLRGQTFTKMSYEDFLQSYGVRSRTVNQKRPELLRIIKDWQYPSNTVDPATGGVSTALSWSISESADKDRFFEEPGFIAVFSVARPKLFMMNQQSIIPHLDSAFSWLPAIMDGKPEISLKQFESNTGPVGAFTPNYWVDMRDAFLYGDQFVDLIQSGTAATNTVNAINFPIEGVTQTKWVTETIVDKLFVGSTDETQCVKQDGVLQATILGSQRDAT